MHGFRGPRAALVAAALIAGGCVGAVPGAGAGGGGDGGGGGSLAGRTFLSESVTENGEPRPLVPGTRIELGFTDEGQVTASAGCNSMFGPVAIGRHRLDVGSLSSTDMACSEPLEAQDEWLAGVLTADPAYRLRSDRLRIVAGATVIRLVDAEVAQPDLPLEGTVWRLDGLVDGDAVSTLPPGTGATIVFGPETVQVSIDDCNMGRASAAVRGSEIDVSILTMTERACPEGPTLVEDAVVRALVGTIGYAIDGGTLTLSHPSGRGLVLRAA